MSPNSTNPFFSSDLMNFLDMTKFMDPNKMAEMFKVPDFSKMMDGCCKMPNFDVDAMMAAQRKNIESLTSTNQKAIEGLQAYMTKQAELARASFDAATKLVQDVVAAPTPQEKIVKQVEATQASIDTCMNSLKELSELLSQQQAQTMKVVSDAMREGMGNLQDLVKNNFKS